MAHTLHFIYITTIFHPLSPTHYLSPYFVTQKLLLFLNLPHVLFFTRVYIHPVISQYNNLFSLYSNPSSRFSLSAGNLIRKDGSSVITVLEEKLSLRKQATLSLLK